jgi:AcrR family transcriptional regulator
MLSVPVRGRRLTRDEKRAQTRLQLLQAAATVFPRRGYHATSVDEVAEEAGFTVGALYSNFSGKQDLFLAMLEEHFARQMALYAEISSRGHTVEAKARGAADHWMAFLQRNPQFFPLFIEFWGLALRDPELRRQFSSRIRHLREAIGDLIKHDASELGVELPDDAADALAMVVNSLGNGLALHMMVDPKAVPKDLFGDMLALIFEALKRMYESGGIPAVDATPHKSSEPGGTS